MPDKQVSRRRAAARERILQAAEATFIEKGFHGASIDLIASRAGYTSGAIYWNFRDKDELFLAVSNNRFERLFVEQSQQFHEATSDDEITSILAKVASEQDETYDKWSATSLEFLAYVIRNPDVFPQMQATVQRGIQWLEATFAPLAEKCAVPVPDFALIVLALMNGLAVIRLTNDSVDHAALIALTLSRMMAGAEASEEERP